MKQTLQKLLIAIVGLFVSANAFAHGFEVGGIYYSVSSTTNLTCAVTYRGDSYYSYVNEYIGDVTIPETVTYNGITYSVTSIREYAFYGCNSLKSVTIGNSVTSIGSYAFYNCYSLKSVTIGNSVTSIGDEAFFNCNGLNSVTIGNSVTSIGDKAFYNCNGLNSVTIPNSVTSIGDKAFSMYKSSRESQIPLKKVVWLTNTPPSGYTEIYSSAHYVANDLYTGLSGVTIYPYLSSMFEVDGIKYVPVSPSERTCDAIDCAYDSTATNINIGKNLSYKGIAMSLNEIKPYTCYNNDYIKDVTIDITGDIPNECFYSCSAIEKATITAETIGYLAFASSATKNPATFDINATTINENAFSGCSAIEKATITAGTIRSWAFASSATIYPATFTLGDNLKSIGYSAFNGCGRLEKITIPDAVTSMGSDVFSGCYSLNSVHIGTGISAINNDTFYGCSSLPEITIPSNVTSIGNFVFDGCTSLADVTIADRETELSLGSNGPSPMFSDCPLKTVYIGGNISYPTSSSYGYSPFYRNTTLETVTITDKETEISENEFYGCSSLKNITMGDGVESIGNWAFSGCSSLDYFSFGSGMKTIGEEAFSDCTAMTKLISNATTPPTCGTQALDDINKWTCELVVPQNSLSAYQAADQWKEFFFISESGIEDIVADGNEISIIAQDGEIIVNGIENAMVEVYNISGQLVYTGNDTTISVADKGIYIVKVADKTFKVAL